MRIQKNKVLIDETFWVFQTRFGLWSTETVEGYEFQIGVTGLHREDVILMTRWHLKHLQEGDLDDYSRVVGDAFVDGKL